MGWSLGHFKRVLVDGWAVDKLTTPEIQASRHDINDDDLAIGIDNCLAKDGTNSPTGHLNFGTYKITNLGDPAADQDAVTKASLSILSEYVGATQLQDDAVVENKIMDDAVTTNKILDGAITEDKLADDAVTEDKILDASITEDKIFDNAVTENKIADEAITEDKLADDAVSSDKIADLTYLKTNILNTTVTEVDKSAGGTTFINNSTASRIIYLMGSPAADFNLDLLNTAYYGEYYILNKTGKTFYVYICGDNKSYSVATNKGLKAVHVHTGATLDKWLLSTIDIYEGTI